MPAFPDLSLLFPTELPDSLPATGLALLDQEAVLAVQGTDATRFLQGQLTCDVAALQPGEHTLGARRTPQRRMQSTFRLPAALRVAAGATGMCAVLQGVHVTGQERMS